MSPALFVLVTRFGLALLFVYYGAQLILGGEGIRTDFHLETYPEWLARALGVVQVLGGIALPIRRMAPYAVAVLLPIMSGAVWTVLQADKRTAEADVYLPTLAAALLLAVLVVPEDARSRARRPTQPRPRPPAPTKRGRPRRAARPVRRRGPYEEPSGSLPIRGPNRPT